MKDYEINDIIIKENQIILSDSLIKMLNAKAGDKISIQYTTKDGNLIPVICVDKIGNVLNKNGTVSFRGKQRETLGQFGVHFQAINNNNVIELEGDGIPIFTDIKKAIKTLITENIIKDINYNITKITNYEF